MTSVGCNKPITKQESDSIHRYVADNLIDAELSKDAKLAVTLSRTRELSVWNNASKSLLHQWQVEDFDEPTYLVSLSGNNKYLAVTGKHQVSIFDLKSGRLEVSWLAQGFDSSASISSLYLSQSGRRILLGMNEGSVITVDLESNQLSMFQLHDGPVSHVEFLSYGERILSSAYDGHALIWASSNGQVIKDFSLAQRITSISFDEAERRIFIADVLDKHIIADSHSGESISQLSFLGRYRYFRQALFADRGKTLITASSKQKIMSWDLNTGKEKKHWNITVFTAGTTVLDMTINSSGQLMTLSSDGALEIWDY
ncbi:WD40 repeat domain-containing protein [Shewanella psychropiezotolerans]|uniref:Serine-threonine kinase receptor-associated protein n=1 Tax=Shewanella psychropiezotolerans TaxID=2593655 RepID=A0ABX5X5B4_9GAMM|nr:WD40 repeat domain-containing protein [Shewanella sp. YLB-07]QDO86530.1 WD40 repeat domain-containing protein [Shewanella psychropiezotolerans]